MKYLLLILILTTQVNAKLPKLDTLLSLPAIDTAFELAKNTQVEDKSQPLLYAISTKIDNVFIHNDKSMGGQWNQLSDGSWIWRVLVNAENAKSLDFGFYDFYLPPTAELRFYDWAGNLAKGPFTDQKNMPHKQLWPGPIIGDVVTVELKVSDKYKKYISFTIKNISRGFRSIWNDVELIVKNNQQKFWAKDEDNAYLKSGSCNVDVICDDGDDWRDQIRSVARYTINGSGLCTGQMLNNTANDGKPLFLTAHHCGFNNSNDATINIWWNYESNQCRVPGSGTSGNPISISSFNDTQSGSTFRATHANSDMTLLELDNTPNSSFNVFYTGWDRQNTAPQSVVGIHHPSGHAKRISFENNPTSIISNVPVTGIPQSSNSHISVADWDSGTTEGGSSGSGIWNPEKLLVGVLTGGGAACGNNASDYYGRLNIGWEGGGTANSRLRDWLDPNNTGAQTLQGLGDDSCSAMTISINQTNTDAEIGLEQIFSATISGGTAPYSYQWDVNDDENTDGSEATITATYAQKYVGNISLDITDNIGCTASGSKSVIIESPKITLINGSNSATQICGNNNNFIEPGERWSIPVVMQNNGFVNAQNAYTVFSKSSSNTIDLTAQDNFGNGVSLCDRSFLDISSTGQKLSLIAAGNNFSAQDEGVAPIELTEPFDFYGQEIRGLYLSSNGYISIDPNESGFDFDNDCPIPTLPNNTANGVSTLAKIMPMHDDLIVQNIYHQYFTTCPRQDNPTADLSCDVFMYSDVDIFDNNNPTVEHFNFEAILYPSTSQWVFQYDGVGFRSDSSSVGIQNNNATDGVGFSCNTNNGINTQQAVCVHHRDALSQSNPDVDFYHLETPVIALGDLPVSLQHSNTVEFSVAQNAQCGSEIKINAQAAVYEGGFNEDGTEVLSTTLGNNGSCSVISNCSPESANDITARNGLWYNPDRSGNGNDMYFSPNGLIYLQYTAKEDRSPIWYITGSNSYMQNNQAFNELTSISYNGPFLSSTQSTKTVGSSLTTLIDAETAVQTRTINGKFSAELIQSFIYSNDTTNNQRTGLWYNPAESGWGETVGTQGDVEVIVNYIYDNSGQPYWVLGSGANNAIENIDMLYFNAFCPHCPKVPLQNTTVGTTRINYAGSNTTATMESMQINVSGEHESQWNRTNMPLSLLTPPVE